MTDENHELPVISDEMLDFLAQRDLFERKGPKKHIFGFVWEKFVILGILALAWLSAFWGVYSFVSS